MPIFTPPPTLDFDAFCQKLKDATDAVQAAVADKTDATGALEDLTQAYATVVFLVTSGTAQSEPVSLPGPTVSPVDVGDPAGPPTS